MGKQRKFTNCSINTHSTWQWFFRDVCTTRRQSIMRWTSLLAATIQSVDIALDKLPVDDGKGVLTSCLKYIQRAISPPCVQQKTLVSVERGIQKLRRYLFSWFNNCPRNPRNFLSLKISSPTVIILRKMFLDTGNKLSNYVVNVLFISKETGKEAVSLSVWRPLKVPVYFVVVSRFINLPLILFSSCSFGVIIKIFLKCSDNSLFLYNMYNAILHKPHIPSEV